MNPPAAALRGKDRKAALDSARMDFKHPDAAPEQKLNRILWHDAKGWGAPYPTARHSLFVPRAASVPDKDRREKPAAKRRD